jgi:TonB family protein
LLAVLLIVWGLPGAEMLAASQPVPTLDSHAAARLLIHMAKPTYPAVAEVNFIQGSVKLLITVSPKGEVIATHIVEGEPLLAAAAIEAVRKWLYRPYNSSKGISAFSTDVVVKFRLRPRTFNGRLPKNADAYLEKQIRPPEVLFRPRSESATDSVRFKVLVDSKGEILDSTPLETKGANIELAQEHLQHWKFQPARWGALVVPWYVIVEVPFNRAAADPAAFAARH